MRVLSEKAVRIYHNITMMDLYRSRPPVGLIYQNETKRVKNDILVNNSDGTKEIWRSDPDGFHKIA